MALSRERRRSALLALSVAVYLFMTAWIAWAAWKKKDWGFDVVCYSAAALSWTIDDPVELHHSVFDQVKGTLPAHDFRSVTSDSAYRKAVHRDPTALQSIVPFYVNKPLYVAAVALLHRAGVNVAVATRVVSVSSYVAVALLALAWALSSRAGPLAILAAAAILCAPPFRQMAYLPSPDMMVCVPLLAGVGIMLGRGRVLLGLVMTLVAVFVRPDSGMLVLGLIAWAMLALEPIRLPLRHGLALAAATLLVALLVPKLAGGTGMRTLLRHSFEQRLHEPSRMSEKISLRGYIKAIRGGLQGKQLYWPSLLFNFLAAGLTILYAMLSFGPSRLRRSLVAFFLALWSYIPLHFLLFPDAPDRYFAPTYLLMGTSALFYWLRTGEGTPAAPAQGP